MLGLTCGSHAAVAAVALAAGREAGLETCLGSGLGLGLLGVSGRVRVLRG